jgi:hypothetical protein
MLLKCTWKPSLQSSLARNGIFPFSKYKLKCKLHVKICSKLCQFIVKKNNKKTLKYIFLKHKVYTDNFFILWPLQFRFLVLTYSYEKSEKRIMFHIILKSFLMGSAYWWTLNS